MSNGTMIVSKRLWCRTCKRATIHEKGEPADIVCSECFSILTTEHPTGIGLEPGPTIQSTET